MSQEPVSFELSPADFAHDSTTAIVLWERFLKRENRALLRELDAGVRKKFLAWLQEHGITKPLREEHLDQLLDDWFDGSDSNRSDSEG